MVKDHSDSRLEPAITSAKPHSFVPHQIPPSNPYIITIDSTSLHPLHQIVFTHLISGSTTSSTTSKMCCKNGSARRAARKQAKAAFVARLTLKIYNKANARAGMLSTATVTTPATLLTRAPPLYHSVLKDSYQGLAVMPVYEKKIDV